MPRKSQKQAVAERANQILNEQQEQRRTRRQQTAQTRRQRREPQQAEAQPPTAAESATQANVVRIPRPATAGKPRVHADLVTVAFRAPLAEKLRIPAEQSGMSLAKLLQDAALVYEQKIAEGYEPGSTLVQWREQKSAADA